jgi:hypothetical protein
VNRVRRHQNRIIMDDAELIPLATCADVRAGYPFRGPIEELASGSVRVVQMKDVHPQDGLDWSRAVRTELPGRKPPDWLQAGDLLFVPRGNHFFAACVDTPPGPAVCGPHLFHLRVRPGAGLLPAFLAWQINQPPWQRQLHAAAEGSSQLSIRIGELEALGMAVPAIAQQERIVALADAVRQERRLLERLQRNREQELAAIAHRLAQGAGRGGPRTAKT